MLGGCIQAINLVVLLPESPECAQREYNYYHTTEAVTLASLYFSAFRHSLNVIRLLTFEHSEHGVTPHLCYE